MSSCGSPSVLSRWAWGNDCEQNAAPDGGRILVSRSSTSPERPPRVSVAVRYHVASEVSEVVQVSIGHDA